MSRHWDPNRDWSRQATGRAFRWNRPRRRARARGRSRWRFSAGEIRLTLLGGIFAGLAIALIGLPVWTQGPAPQGAAGAGVTRSDVTIARPGEVRMIDGDTFRFRGLKVRIADIDTPEMDGRCAHESDLARRATARMRTLIAQGPIELHPLASGRDEDQYGRKLRVVIRDGRSLGDQLVSEGLARTWTGRREGWC